MQSIEDLLKHQNTFMDAALQSSSSKAAMQAARHVIGPMLLGHLFSWMLLGMLIVQCYIYYLAFPNDRRATKYLVLWVLFSEILQTALVTRDAYRNFASQWGNLSDLDNVGWLWFSVPVMFGITTFTAHLFYAWRIYVLSGHKVISVVVTFVSTLQAVAAIWSGVAAYQIGSVSKVFDHIDIQILVWFGGAAICDVLIASLMFYYLRKSRGGFRQTNVLLKKIVRVSLETGLLCAALSVVDLVFIRDKRSSYRMLVLPLSKIYSNSLVVVLNTRVRLTGGREHEEQRDGSPISFIHTSQIATHLRNSRVFAPPKSINGDQDPKSTQPVPMVMMQAS